MIVRVNKNKNYTTMSNAHLRDKDLSLKAKGMLSVMLSLPDDWDYSIAGLVAISKENETAIKSAINELKAVGYIVVTKRMPNETPSGRFEYVYDIYEQKQEGKKQGIENQGLEFQAVENPAQINTKEQNTEEQNTEYIKYITEQGYFDYQKVAELWNFTCFDLPSVKVITDTRKKQIRASNRQIKGEWETFFARIHASDFLCGRSGKWKASFDWCLKSANLVKIIEGNYDNKSTSYMDALKEYMEG